MSKTSALNWGGSKEVKIGLNLFGTRILETVRGQNVSKTSALNQEGPKEVKIGLISFGTRILEIC